MQERNPRTMSWKLGTILWSLMLALGFSADALAGKPREVCFWKRAEAACKPFGAHDRAVQSAKLIDLTRERFEREIAVETDQVGKFEQTSLSLTPIETPHSAGKRVHRPLGARPAKARLGECHAVWCKRVFRVGRYVAGEDELVSGLVV